MQIVNVREARKRMSELLDEALHGAVIAITRRGKVVALLVPPEAPEEISFPDMSVFRETVTVSGKPTSRVVEDMRKDRV